MPAFGPISRKGLVRRLRHIVQRMGTAWANGYQKKSARFLVLCENEWE
jgi:hypothetical protein